MKINILNEGYVKFIEAAGRGLDKRHRPETRRQANFAENVIEWVSEPDFEIGIVEAARQSTQGSFRGWDQGDDKLLRTLFMSHPQHATPFEFSWLVIEVQAPLFVFREWHRHRTQSYNEMSARYARLPDVCYEPNLVLTMARCEAARTTRNKQQQGESTAPVIPADVEAWLERGKELQTELEEFYDDGLHIGIPKELARYNMPVSHYSRMRAATNLRNWLAFMTLRDETGVQCETRQYATALGAILQATFPQTMQLFEQKRAEYREYLEWRKQRNTTTTPSA